MQVGGVDPKQLAVYEEFARNVPGFLPSNDLSQPTGFLAQPMKVRFYKLLSIIISFIRHWLKHYLCCIFRPTRLNSTLWLTATGLGHR